MEKERLREVIFAAIALAALNDQEDMEHKEEHKNPAEAKQEREKDINDLWKKIAINYLHRLCSECPATDGDDCQHWDVTCGHSLRKKYESMAGIPHLEKNAKEWMKDTKSKIKPCLCASVPYLWYEPVGYYNDSVYFSIYCEKCGIKMEGVPHSPFLATEEKMKFLEEIVEKWNTWIVTILSQNMQ